MGEFAHQPPGAAFTGFGGDESDSDEDMGDSDDAPGLKG
jgi:hypothetical protein